MLRLNKNKPLLHTLRDRELGNVTSQSKLGFNILRHLITAPESTFEKVWIHHCTKRTYCEDGKLYLHDFDECVSLWGKDNKPGSLYNFEKRPGKKIDCLPCPGRHVSNCPGYLDINNPSSYRAFFLAVSDDNWLRSYDNQTGKILQEVYLGDPKTYKFRHCLWETVGDRAYVTGNVRQKRMCTLQRCSLLHVYAVIAVFKVFPLRFVAMMEITDKKFGTDVKKINIDGSTLVIGRGTTSDSVISLYNFNHILRNNMLFKARLKQRCLPFKGIVGCFPDGLPMNCFIQQTPPLLFQVKCSDYAVHFGGNPWHYMVLQAKRTEYHIRPFADDAITLNNTLTSNDSGFDNERAYFHYDFSERIIFECTNEIQMHKVSQNADKISSVDLLFSMNFFDQDEATLRETKKKRLLRPLNPRIYFTATKSVMSMDYEDQLDLIAVMGFNPRDAMCAGMIHLYDNFTGDLVKVFELNIVINEVLKYELVFNLDTMVITHDLFQNQFRCFVYRLSSQEENAKQLHMTRYRCMPSRSIL